MSFRDEYVAGKPAILHNVETAMETTEHPTESKGWTARPNDTEEVKNHGDHHRAVAGVPDSQGHIATTTAPGTSVSGAPLLLKQNDPAFAGSSAEVVGNHHRAVRGE